MAKYKAVNPMPGFKDVLDEIRNSQDVFGCLDNIEKFFPRDDNRACLDRIIPIDFINEKNHISDRLFGKDRVLLSNLMTGTNDNGILGVREDLAKFISSDFSRYKEMVQMKAYETAFNRENICSSFRLKSLPKVYKALTSNAEMTGKKTRYDDFVAIDYVKKYILYLFGTKKYDQFFFYLFLFSILQGAMSVLDRELPATQYREITNYVERMDNISCNIRQYPSTIVKNGFWDLRRKLVRSAHGHLMIAGASLREAFRRGDSNDISNELIFAIQNKQLTRLSIFLTDPLIFEESSSECGQPIRDIDEAVKSLQENIYRVIHETQQSGHEISLHIYFLPLLQIDHAVITEEFMAFRTNKLWNFERLYRGNFMLHSADYYYNTQTSEYKAHVDYLDMIIKNSTIIYPDVDIDDPLPERFSPRSYHMEWREYLKHSDYKNIYLYKVYEKQIFNYVCNTWSSVNGRLGELTGNSRIRNYEDFYNPRVLLNDRTQHVLLDYIKVTERLFLEAIKKHGKNETSYCHLIPSLDLGFPNNVQRLAGGFATGMLVTWQCGIDIVPVDATVNICTSSVFKLDRINPEWIERPETFYEMIKCYRDQASEEKGYSFSFLSGNHFLLLAKDSITQEYYIVMHSSANEFKHSYMGLYPVEGNWYSDKIKHIEGENGRYFRYLKDEDARYFVRMVNNFQKYNEQIHQWLAQKINGGEFQNTEKWMKHHYYMPTSQSIAIGTFAEPIGTQVPIFSSYQKPVYIFEIGPDNFQINLGEKKGKVCLIPHGWGQEIEHVKAINVDRGNLIISTDEGDFSSTIKSQEHIECPGKRIRQYEDGEQFLKMGSNYIHGRIVKTLIPVCEYSRNGMKLIEKNI